MFETEDVKTEQRRELAVRLAEYLGLLEVVVGETIALLNGADPAEAQQNIVDIMDGLEWSIQGITILGGAVALDVTEIQQILISINDILENNDGALLADLFEHQMLPLIQYWRVGLSRLSVMPESISLEIFNEREIQ